MSGSRFILMSFIVMAISFVLASLGGASLFDWLERRSERAH